MTPDIRVLLADDDARYRSTLRTLFDATPGISVLAEATDGNQAVNLTRNLDLDIVLMDIRMPALDGLSATERIIRDGRDVRIIILTTFDLDGYVFRALRAGAAGFLLKDSPPTRLLDGIAAAAAGDSLLAPSVTRRLIAEFTDPTNTHRSTPRRLDGITAREREVLTLITRGLSNQEIEQHLFLSRSTVKTHIGSLMAKLHARDRAQLVIAGYESGLENSP